MVGDARNIFEISSIELREGVKKAVRLTALEVEGGSPLVRFPDPHYVVLSQSENQTRYDIV